MIAARRDDVDDLNHRARQRLLAAGVVQGPSVVTGGRTFQAGDEVLFTRNDHGLRVVNGQRGTVHAVTDDRLQVATDGAVLIVSREYFNAGHLHHGYATTAHKAQGVTVDRTFVLASDVIYPEWAYVALSRGRHSNTLYTVDADDGDGLGGMKRQARQQLASDSGTPASCPPGPLRRHLDQLIAHRSDARRELQAAADNTDQAQARVRRAEAGIGRVRRRHTVAELRRQAALAATALVRWHERVTELDAEMDNLGRRLLTQPDRLQTCAAGDAPHVTRGPTQPEHDLRTLRHGERQRDTGLSL